MNFTVDLLQMFLFVFAKKLMPIYVIKKMAKFLYIQNVCHQKIPRNLTYQLKLKSR